MTDEKLICRHCGLEIWWEGEGLNRSLRDRHGNICPADGGVHVEQRSAEGDAEFVAYFAELQTAQAELEAAAEQTMGLDEQTKAQVRELRRMVDSIHDRYIRRMKPEGGNGERN